MRRLIFALVAVVALTAGSTRAEAYSYTCRELVNLITSPSLLLNGAGLGYTVGTIDFLAGLHCFTGHQRCNCLARAFDRDDYGTILGQELAGCINRGEGNTPAFGAAVRAAARFCP